MKLPVLKYFSSVFVSISETTDKNKLYFINKIKESKNKDQILDFLSTGTFNNQLLTESKKLNDLENYLDSLIEQQDQMGLGTAVAILAAPFVVAAAIITASAMTYKNILSKAARACKRKSGSEKTECMKKFKKDALESQINALKSGMTKCSKSKDPTKCRKKVIKKIDDLKYKHARLTLKS